MYSNLKTKEFNKLRISTKQNNWQRYKYIKCSNCNWRMCDAPDFIDIVAVPLEKARYITDNHVICKCQRCGAKQIIIIN